MSRKKYFPKKFKNFGLYSPPLIISEENKNCILVGDFNIDLLKLNLHDDVNNYYNNLTNHLFTTTNTAKIKNPY